MLGRVQGAVRIRHQDPFSLQGNELRSASFPAGVRASRPGIMYMCSYAPVKSCAQVVRPSGSDDQMLHLECVVHKDVLQPVVFVIAFEALRNAILAVPHSGVLRSCLQGVPYKGVLALSRHDWLRLL